MKKTFFIVCVLILSIAYSCSQNKTSDKKEQTKELTKIEFADTIHDFGNIDYEGNGNCEFKFKNTGEKSLVLSSVNSSCGCTVPEWPREPINPGEESEIRVKYNTKRPGRFQKSITIYSNTETSPLKLIIKGTVGPKPVAEATK